MNEFESEVSGQRGFFPKFDGGTDHVARKYEGVPLLAFSSEGLNVLNTQKALLGFS